MSTRLIALDGAVETAIRLGVADVIADVVETGTTLRQAVWSCSAIRSCFRSDLDPPYRRGAASGLDQLERRLNGVWSPATT